MRTIVPRPQQQKRDIVEASLLSLLLVLYSNGLAVWSLRRSGDPEKPFRVLNPLFLGLLLLYARIRPGLWPLTDLTPESAGKSALWGVGLGLAISAPPLLFFYKPILLDTPLEYGPVGQLSRRDMVGEVFVRLPVSVALLEELAFRGLVYDTLRRSMSAAIATAVSSSGFAAWHLTVTATSAAETNLADAKLPAFLKPFILPLSVLGGMASTGIAGAVFALVRERTGSLVGAVVAHWLVDTLMVLSLWLRRSHSDRQTPPGS